MTRMILAYGVTLTVFVGLDMIWLLFVARDYYRAQMGDLMAQPPLLLPAIAFYFLIAAGVVIFGVSSGLRENSWTAALLYGALFGFFAYATYDLTNLAVVRNWPVALTFVDLAWGTALVGVSSLCGYLAVSAAS